MLAVPYSRSANERFDTAHDVREAQPRHPHQHCRRSGLRRVGYLRDAAQTLGRVGRSAGRAGRSNAPASVTLAPVRAQRVSQKLEALGNARANESVDISTKTSNIVTAVTFRDGERVKRGQVLVQLDNAQARADVAAAQAAVTESESLYNRSRELLNTQALSKSSFDQLEATLKANRARLAAASARLEDTVIRAPFSGRVGLRRVSVGTLISPGDVITTLDDTSVIKLDFSVPENFLASLREGLSIRASAPAFPGRSFAGKVASIDSRVDMDTRSVIVRALLANEDGALKPGMFLNVSLANDEREALVIPEEALTPEAERQYVYVVADGKVSRREVRIGGRQPGTVEILAGLSAGERVIVEGTQKVRDGATVTCHRAHGGRIARRPGRQVARSQRGRREPGEHRPVSPSLETRAMMISDLSVRRPVFATVMSLLLFILGIGAVTRLSLREFPDVDRPVVSIETRYRGAGSDVVESRITQIIENEISGIEGVERLNSASRDERSQINVEFTLERDLDSAANDVRERLSRVAQRLPLEADPPQITKVDSGAGPDHLPERREHAAEHARDHRLHGALSRRPVRDARRRGLGAHERRAALRDARVAVARESRGPAAHRRRRRELAAARERGIARRPPRIARARILAAHRHQPAHRRRLPQSRRGPRPGRLSGASRRSGRGAPRLRRRPQPLALQRRHRAFDGDHSAVEGERAGDLRRGQEAARRNPVDAAQGHDSSRSTSTTACSSRRRSRTWCSR